MSDTSAQATEATYTEGEVNAAIVKAVGEHSDQNKALVDQNEKLTDAMASLQKEIAEFRARPPIFGPEGDNGVAGSDRTAEKSIIKRLPNGDVMYQTVAKDTKDFLKEIQKASDQLGRGVGSITIGGSPNYDLVTKTTTVADNTSAGFLVPGEWSNVLWEKVYEDSWWLTNAEIMPMTRDFIEGPILDQTFGSSPSYDGGIDFSPRGAEDSTVTENTNPSFSLKDFRAKEYVGLQKISKTFDSDTPWFISWLTNRGATAARREIDSHVWRGNGSSQMLGFLGHPNVEVVARATAAQFRRADGLNLDAAVDEAFGENLVFLMRKATNIDYGKDTNVDTTWLDATGTAPYRRQIGGYPVQITKHPSALGTEGDVVMCDPKSYLIALRQGIEVEVSRERYWDERVIGLMFHWRMDGQPLFPDGIKVLGDAP